MASSDAKDNYNYCRRKHLHKTFPIVLATIILVMADIGLAMQA